MVTTVRTLTVDDWPVWRELRLAALAEAPYAFGTTLAQWQGEGDRPDRWRARLATPGSHHVTAVAEDGVRVGMAAGMPTDSPGTVELMSLWVGPRARGTGTGELLIAEIERWSRQQGAHTLRLAVLPANSAALGLYRRAGFANSGVRTRQLEDRTIEELVMSRQLLGAD
ncbi:GNAT family N-acetyltransferase [Streptomyces sp. XM4193]|uniref:GNAT family N-acetyltransferase n=1 Tax=Streptomyces sp. XM4193 TaxID=2929782 RepID=UPI001FF80085|nr:GNAT family N-acetyltransferase [Streptomyces sp. XM4193]MCK1794888.1 GNAT family N-acetyltransferase [Streptomyces sp. XM4193]